MDKKPSFSQQLTDSKGMSILKTPMLIWALCWDRRIDFKLKLIPLGTLLWVVFPDLIPGILDDLFLVYFGPKFFLDRCNDRFPKVYKELYDKVLKKVGAI